MKFSISSRQPEEYLNKADELFIDWKDNNVIYDIAHLAPNKTLILKQDKIFSQEDWDKIIKYKSIFKEQLKLALLYIYDCQQAAHYNITFYYNMPINDWAQLNYFIDLGVSEIIPGPTLSHCMNILKRKNIPIRAIVDKHMMPKNQDSIVGAWIRPEDLWSSYNNYIDYVEFSTDVNFEDLKREQALYRIYAENKEWPGDINMLIPDINSNAINRLIVSDFGERRANCQQKCEISNNCHFCQRALQLATTQTFKQILKQKEQ